MKGKARISRAVIKRLPRYCRFLADLKRKGVYRISSQQLSELMGYTASQVRQDFNNFGDFGQQGYGYNVEELHDELETILGLKRTRRVVIVGAGNLGRAIANYIFLYERAFDLVAMFDNNEKLIGSEINGIYVQNVDELADFLKRRRSARAAVDIGAIMVSKRNAQEIADILVAGRVKGIWNFAATDLNVPEKVALRDVHLSDTLHELAYYVTKR